LICRPCNWAGLGGAERAEEGAGVGRELRVAGGGADDGLALHRPHQHVQEAVAAQVGDGVEYRACRAVLVLDQRGEHRLRERGEAVAAVGRPGAGDDCRGQLQTDQHVVHRADAAGLRQRGLEGVLEGVPAKQQALEVSQAVKAQGLGAVVKAQQAVGVLAAQRAEHDDAGPGLVQIQLGAGGFVAGVERVAHADEVVGPDILDGGEFAVIEVGLAGDRCGI
jgi:hypothetical protein